ncbi:MAG TPA: transglutaminase domain-containing protein, partial [Gemmataceae bacterium]
PDLGPGQYYLEFRVPTRGGPRLRADPDAEAYGPNGERLSTILMRPEGLSSRPGASGFPWTRSMEGELSPPAFALGRNESVYLQVAKPSDHPGVSGPLAYQDGYLEHLRNCQSVPKLNEWTHELFRQLAAEGRLPAAVTLDDAGRVAPQHYEAVCRAFEDYLSRSGDFKYSLTLTRADVQIDPVEDFVCNTRRGHCTRFASALALMLRSVGVPTRVVLGYRGFEQAGDGIYDVLQCHAHSWVEAIIQRPVDHGQPAADANVAQPGPVASPWRWLTLDPTPTGEEVELTEFSWGQCWEYTRQGIGTFFKNFIIEYDADQQERAKYAVSQSSWWALPTMAKRLALGPTGDDWGRAGLLAVCCVAAVVLTRRAVRRWRSLPARSANPATAFYDRMLAALRRTFGLAPRTGQTPGEFAADAGERLRAVPATCDVSGVPADAAVLYYRVRFGNRPLAAEERRALDARLDRLETALTGGAGKSAARNPSAV